MLVSRPVNPRDPIVLLRERLAQAHREAAAALDAGDEEGYETAVAVGEIYRMRLAAVRGHGGDLETPHLHSRTHRATINATMQTQKVQKGAPVKRRPGVPLKSKGPVAQAARNSGKSMFEIAGLLGESYDSVKTWNHRAIAPERIRTKLNKPPYSVPLDAWK